MGSMLGGKPSHMGHAWGQPREMGVPWGRGAREDQDESGVGDRRKFTHTVLCRVQRAGHRDRAAGATPSTVYALPCLCYPTVTVRTA